MYLKKLLCEFFGKENISTFAQVCGRSCICLSPRVFFLFCFFYIHFKYFFRLVFVKQQKKTVSLKNECELLPEMFSAFSLEFNGNVHLICDVIFDWSAITAGTTILLTDSTADVIKWIVVLLLLVLLSRKMAGSLNKYFINL